MRPIDMNDPSTRRAWLEDVRTNVLDLVAIAEDATKPYRERFFARWEAKRRITDLERTLLALLDGAAGSLRPMALVLVPPAPLPASPASDDEGPPSTMRPT